MSNSLPNDLNARLDAIEALIKDMSDRIKKIENNLTDVPIIPDMPVSPRPFTPAVPWLSRCEKCGLNLEQAMGYVCPQPKCPTGLGGAWCGTSTAI